MANPLVYTIDGDDNPLRASLARAQGHFKALEGGVGNVMSGLTAQFGKLNVMITSVVAALAGGAAFKASVEATKEFTLEATKLARVLGSNATEAGILNVALGDIYADSDTYATAAAKLAKEIRTNEDALKGMGLQTRDAQGQLRPLKDLMMDSIGVVNSYQQGIDRNIAAQTMWGKGAEEASALLKLNNEVVDQARAKAEALGLVIGVENVQATVQYRAAINDVGDVLLGLRKVIGDALMPILTKFGEWFALIGPAAVTVLRGALGGLISVFWALKNGVVVLWETINAMVVSVAEPIRALAAALGRALHGDFAGAAEEIKGIAGVVANSWKTAFGEILKSGDETRERIGNLFMPATAIATAPAKGRSAGSLVKSGKDAKPEKDSSLMPAWQAELDALKQAHAERNAADGTFYEFSKEQEKAFWQAKQDIAAAGSTDHYAVQAKITSATLALQQDAFEQRMASLKREQDATAQDVAARRALAQKELDLIAQRYGAQSKQAEEARRRIDAIERASAEQRATLRAIEMADISANANQQIELERQRLRLLGEAGLLSREEMLVAEAGFEERRYQIQQQALLQRQALIDPTLNPVEYARIKNEILEIERQHQLLMGEIQNQTFLAHTEQTRSLLGNIQSGWANTIKGVLTGAQTITQGIRGLFKTVFDSVVGMLAQMVAKWMVQQILMKVFGKSLALGKIAEESAKAGAGGVASMAAAPFPLNLTAPAFGAAMAAAAMAFAPVASAAGGFDIPAGLNPITQLHQREMVLPEGPAQVIRDMAEGGAGGAPIVIHGVTAGDFFIAHKRELAKMLKGMKRDFEFQ